MSPCSFSGESRILHDHADSDTYLDRTISADILVTSIRIRTWLTETISGSISLPRASGHSGVTAAQRNLWLDQPMEPLSTKGTSIYLPDMVRLIFNWLGSSIYIMDKIGYTHTTVFLQMEIVVCRICGAYSSKQTHPILNSSRLTSLSGRRLYLLNSWYILVI